MFSCFNENASARSWDTVEFMAFLAWRLPADHRHGSKEIGLLCNFGEQGTGFNSHWLREWGENFEPITNQKSAKPDFQQKLLQNRDIY